MSLEKQLIPVSFNGGLDTKTAEQLVMPGSFLVLENCVRRKSMRTQMRYGFTNLGTSISGTTSVISQGRKLDTFISDLLLLNDTNMYSYTSSTDNWVDRGEISSVLVDAYPVIRNSDIQTMADMANGSGLTVTAWEDSRGGVRCSVFNDETRATVIADGLVSLTGSRPKVVSLDQAFLICYYDNFSLKCRRVAKATPNVLLPEQTVDGGSMSDNPYDIVSYDGYSAVVVYSATGLSVTVGYVDKNGIPGSPAVNGLPSNNSFPIQARSCINVIINATSSRIYIHTHDVSDNIVKVSMMSADGFIKVTQAVATIAGVRNITGVQLLDNSVDVYFEVSAASVKNHYIESFSYTATPTVITPGATSTFKRSVGLIAKAFLYNGVSYVTASHESGLQPTFFTIKSNGNTITRMLSGTGGGLTRDPLFNLKSGLSATSIDSYSKYIFALSIRTRVKADKDGTILATNIGINKSSLSFGNTAFNSAQLGLNYHLAGGMLTAYDGVSPVEHGFHIFPEDLTYTTFGTGAALSQGTYLIRAIYEWVDGKGQIHRSIPSTPLSVYLPNTNEGIAMTVPTLRVTQKTGIRSNAKIVIFRTLVAGSAVYYRDIEITNDPTVDTVTGNLIRNDADLATKEILYTTGGVLDNAPAPSSKVAHKHKNRLFLAGLEDENSVAYSKYQIFGEGTAFADEFRLAVDPLGGGVTALSSLDDKLIIFKKDRSFYLAGDGPLDTGAQSDYSIPQLISSDVGCAYPKSTVITPLGIMFKSDKGIYLLDRGLNTKYIGAPVEDFNSLEVTSSILIEDSNEVRFTTLTGVCLVYNYFFNQWSTFTNYTSISATNALAATSSLQSYLHLNVSGVVGREIIDQYNDNGQQISMAIETNWFSFSGLQGYQRIYRYYVLGDFVSNHTTVIKLAYNFEKFYTETVYFNTKTGLIETYFGDDTVFGESDPFGGSGSGVYQFRSKPAIQKCESIKIRLENLDNIELLPGGCFNLVSMAFEIGQKPAGFKFAGTKNIGST